MNGSSTFRFRNAVHFALLISAILFVLKNPGAVGETYLVSDRATVSPADIATMLRKASKRDPGLIYVPPTLLYLALILLRRRPLWERLSGVLLVDTSKLELLGWRPQVETSDGLAAMLHAWQGRNA